MVADRKGVSCGTPFLIVEEAIELAWSGLDITS